MSLSTLTEVHSTEVWNLKPQPWTSPDAPLLWSLVFFLHLYSKPSTHFYSYPHLPSILFFSVILSSFTLSFFLYSLLLLWEAKKEMNKMEQTVCPWGRRQPAHAPILSSIAWASHRVLGWGLFITPEWCGTVWDELSWWIYQCGANAKHNSIAIH